MPEPKKKRKGRKLWILLILILLAVGAGTGAYLKRGEKPILIQTEKVQRRDLTEFVMASGRIQPVVQVKISPEVSGEIIELPVKEGQAVRKGDLLLRIKPDYYLANRRSAEAAFKSAEAGKALAEANLRKAETDYNQNQTLLTNQLIAESVFTGFKAALEVARASDRTAEHQIDVARAALDRATEDLSKTTIVSPIDGTVSRLNSQAGERVVGTAMMTGTEVMTVADLNEMEARVDIGEIDVVLIAVGQKARLEVDAFRERKFAGTVTEIANSSRNQAGSTGSGGGMGGGQSQEATRFEIRIRVAERAAFRPGMSVSAEIETRSRTNVLSVPIQSVTTRLPKAKASPAAAHNSNQAPLSPSSSLAVTNQAIASANSTSEYGAGSGSNGFRPVGTNGALGSGAADHPSDSLATNRASSSVATNRSSRLGDKAKEENKPIEVVFLREGDTVRALPVKRGISDEDYTEIIEGLREGQEIVSGGYKAISRDLDDGKKVVIGTEPAAKPSP